MDLSLFLARSWGLFLILVCLGIFLNKKKFLSTLSQLDSSSFFIVGLLLLGVGVAQVVGYEMWGLTWQGLLTLFGWATLAKGALLIFVPGYSTKFVKLAVKDHFYMASLVIGLVLGVYLLYVGYLVH